MTKTHSMQDRRIRCMYLYTGVNRMVLSGNGVDGSCIIYRLCEKVRAVEGVNIAGLSALREPDARGGGNFAVIADLYGAAGTLARLAAQISQDPWVDPCVDATEVVGEGLFDLVAPDRTGIIFDALGIISEKHRCNIAALHNTTFTGLQAALAVLNHGGARRDDALETLRNPAGGVAESINDRLAQPGAISITRMKLEVPPGVSMLRVKNEIAALGEGFRPQWTPLRKQPPPHTPRTDD